MRGFCRLFVPIVAARRFRRRGLEGRRSIQLSYGGGSLEQYGDTGLLIGAGIGLGAGHAMAGTT